jgi:hypothetical protein
VFVREDCVALFRAAIVNYTCKLLEDFRPALRSMAAEAQAIREFHCSIAVQHPEKEIPNVKVIPTPDRARRSYPITD